MVTFSNPKEPLILASASPRRRELFGFTGIPFEAVSLDVDEACTGNGETRVAELAYRKAIAAARLYPNRIILAADTLVQVNDEVLGKPENQAEAKEMLKKLSGKWHQVFTGVCLICGEHAQTQVDKTDVLFSELTQELIDGYVATGEPMDKAGSYAVQGRGGMFVEALNGSYSNVIGLPLALVRKMLETAGINLFKNETDV